MDQENVSQTSETQPPTSLQHTFSITVSVDPFWIEYLTQHTDIFLSQYAGYWLRGVEHDEGRGWLCWEQGEEVFRPGDEPNHHTAIHAWQKGEPLPEGWYRLDRAAALRAWEEGVKRFGVNWYENTDAEREDDIVQLALLGEIRYG